MRNRKTVKIDKKEYTVNEMTVQEIIDVSTKLLDQSLGLDQWLELMPAYLKLVSDVELDDLKNMPPSDVKVLYEAFMEVNEDFFAIARSVGLEQGLSELKVFVITTLRNEFGKAVVAS